MVLEMKRCLAVMVQSFALLSTAGAAGHLVSAARAAEPPGQAKVLDADTIRMVLHAAPEPRPSLRYQLLPGLLERRGGNAAIHYLKAQQLYAANVFDSFNRTAGQWLDLPMAKLPREELSKQIARWSEVYEELDAAARSEQCDWQLRLERGPSLLLPEVQGMRDGARLIALKIRHDVGAGKFEDAVRTLQTGFAMARDVAQGRTLVNALVGLSIQKMMSRELQILIEHPQSPNLYWALTTLPPSLIDLNRGAHAEMGFLHLAYPVLRDPEHAQHSPEEWRAQTIRMTRELTIYGDAQVMQEARVFVGALKNYSAAKQRLIAEGRSPERVAAMPVLQVVLTDAVRRYEEVRDDAIRWSYVPYWQAGAGFDRAGKALAAAENNDPFGLLFAIGAMKGPAHALARGQREIALLRTVEAIRLWMDAHGGRLPDRLEEITEVPLPRDPVSGRAFAYRREGDGAILEGHDSPDTTFYWKRRYELHPAPAASSR